MAQLDPCYFIDDAAKAAREAEVPAASFANGANLAGSCAAGIGINMAAGAVVGTPEQFTLLDQFGNARAGQISQHIGGDGYSAAGTSEGSAGTLPDSTIRTGANGAGDGTIPVPAGNATLASLAAGWTAVP